jgi:hypothetical protein
MRIAFASADRGGSWWYRAELPARELRNLGHDVHVGRVVGSRPDGAIYVGRESEMGYQLPFVPDVVILQRLASPEGARRIRQARAAGQVVLMDCDDLLTDMSADNWAIGSQEGRDNIRNWRAEALACNAILCSTWPIVRAMGKLGKAVLAPNLFDWGDPRHVLVEDHGGHKPTLGWVGNCAVHRADLRVLAGMIGDLLDTYDLQLVWGGQRADIESREAFASLLRVDPERVEVREARNMPDDYPKLFSGIDLGIVPLATTSYARAKTATKGLEFAASGIAFIASEHPSYTIFGTGGPRRPHAWRSWIESGLDPATRLRWRITQRDGATRYAVQAPSKWLKGFEEALR